jgi:hypothetical protein
MDLAIAGPSKIRSSRRFVASENDLIKAVILGSRDMLTSAVIDPCAVIEPAIRPEQEKSIKYEINRQIKR